MAYYIGIDLGTSALKLLLVDGNGTIHNTVTRKYPLELPHPGWSQQAPEDWKRAVLEGVPELLRGFNIAEYRMLVYAVILILVMLFTNNPTLQGFFTSLFRKNKKKEAAGK